MTKAYVFDAYGTLFDVHSVVQACESCWPGQGKTLSHLWRAKQLEYTWLRSLMGRYEPFSKITREALEWTCQALGLPGEGHVETLMAEYLRLKAYDDVPEALARLQGRKAILSNGSPDMLEPLVSASGLAFDAVLSVDSVRIFKPAPKVYDLAVKALKTSDIVFVSSNCWDALGAKSFGFYVCWINRGGMPPDRLGFQPDRVLTSLSELS